MQKAFKLASQFKLTKRDKAQEQLLKEAKAGNIRILDGFGEKSELQIIEAIEDSKQHKRERERMLLPKAEEIASRYINYLKSFDFVDDVVALGSLRRRESTVGDLDMAVVTTEGTKAIEAFVNYEEVADVMAKGEKRAAVSLTNETQVDLRIVEKDSLGAMKQYFTGNKQHNVLLRTVALEKGLSISEYGIKENGQLIKYSTEEELYKRLGLPYIPPYLRQGRNEIDKAKANKLPKLITLNDIKGDLHTHTTYSDGTNSIEEMIQKAISLNYEYIGITDHGPSVHSRGRFEVLGIIDKRRDEISKLNEKYDNIKIFYGYEINLLADGEMSMPDDLMKKLDYVIAGLHTAFNQDKGTATRRVINAIENPNVFMIAHPSGRIINQRKAVELDWEQVLDAAASTNTVLEINAHPNRLDLAEDLVLEAVSKNIKLAINTDAHSTADMDLMQYGIDVASRGWCTNANILNTLPYEEISKIIKVNK
ncbi:MAG: DNA polymerase/3'-5' exonuclease PolX [Patescibacteria group bacterium]